MKVKIICPYCGENQEQELHSLEAKLDRCEHCNHPLELKDIVRTKDAFGYEYKPKEVKKEDVFGYNK